jgi:hypothetical protein
MLSLLRVFALGEQRCDLLGVIVVSMDKGKFACRRGEREVDWADRDENI